MTDDLSSTYNYIPKVGQDAQFISHAKRAGTILAIRSFICGYIYCNRLILWLCAYQIPNPSFFFLHFFNLPLSFPISQLKYLALFTQRTSALLTLVLLGGFWRMFCDLFHTSVLLDASGIWTICDLKCMDEGGIQDICWRSGRIKNSALIS